MLMVEYEVGGVVRIVDVLLRDEIRVIALDFCV